ncbi:Pleckstrin homology domain [Trypanosoma melophagium]|uniref:Pleckstrin homology domain n=1 Tax=Trypanosoma melophagium TaxID=715481 RepID=UPI00351A7120|nr:Pleckstrin homology domain [Trypanosoma melophagium]
MTTDHKSIYQKSWLWKQAEWRFAWDRRFFIQDGLRLAYRVEENGLEKKAGYLTSLLREVDPHQPLVFRVWMKEGECWTLRAATAEEHRQWIDSITQALMQDEGVKSDNVREAIVLKKAAWTGQWRQRYFELDEWRLTYRVSKRDVVRKRYALVAVDESDEEGKETELLITTSCGERFWVKFATRKQCKDWKSVILRALRRTMSWHWLTLPSSALSSTTSTYETLHLLYRAYTKGCSDAVVYFYGGTHTVDARKYSRAAKMFLPVVPRETIERQLSMIHLAGEHKCTVLEILPFEENAHAKVRPSPLVGAAICILTLSSLSLSSLVVVGTRDKEEGGENGGERKNKSTPISPLECLFLVGGRSATSPDRDTSTELWWCFPRSPRPQWHRCCYDSSVLPHRTFHTLTARQRSGAILLVGGIDDSNHACADCFLISWGSDEIESSISGYPVVEFFGYLPEPRAFHICLELQDLSLLLLGGQTICNNTASLSTPAASVLRLSVGEKEWKEVSVHPPLPHMDNVCATEALCGTENCVFILGETCTTTRILKLFQLKLQSIDAISSEIDLTIGAVPRGSYGATIHYASGYLYVFGSCYNSNGYGNKDVSLFQYPVRMLIGGNNDNTHHALSSTPS